jgi:hypothetical protein
LGAILVTNRDDQLYVCRKSRRGKAGIFAIPSFNETVYAALSLERCRNGNRTIHLTRQEVERAALELGAKLRTVQQWRYRGVPARWQLKLIEHFGAMIILDDVASQTLPPVKQRTLADICRERYLTPGGIDP